MTAPNPPVQYRPRALYPLLVTGLLVSVGAAAAYSYGYGVLGIALGALLGGLVPAACVFLSILAMFAVAGALVGLGSRRGEAAHYVPALLFLALIVGSVLALGVQNQDAKRSCAGICIGGRP